MCLLCTCHGFMLAAPLDVSGAAGDDSDRECDEDMEGDATSMAQITGDAAPDAAGARGAPAARGELEERARRAEAEPPPSPSY